MANYQVRFGGRRLEKQVKLLAGRLPYVRRVSRKGIERKRYTPGGGVSPTDLARRETGG